jgi:hypothetical protein
MSALIPLVYGRVIGRLVAIVGDTDDADVYPDVVPLAGSVTFTPSVKQVLVASAFPKPATVLLSSVTADLDSDGYLSLNGLQYVNLVATDDPSINPTDFTYTVSFDLKLNDKAVTFSSYSISVPTYVSADDNVVDLTTVAPVSTSGGVTIIRGETGPQGAPGARFDVIPSTASLNDYVTPGIYSLVDPTVLGAVAHDTTIVDPLWDGTFFGVWATLTVTTGNPGLYGDVFQTITKFEGDSLIGIEYLQRQIFLPAGGQTFSVLTPFSYSARRLAVVGGAGGTTQVVPLNSMMGDTWFAQYATTFNLGPFSFGINFTGVVMDVNFVSNGSVCAFTAASGATLVLPPGKKAQLTNGVVHATGMSISPPNGTIYLSGDLDDQVPNAQTGTTYTPGAADLDSMVTLSNASAITVTLPSSATTFPIGSRIDFVVLGAGMATFAAGSGATVNGTPSLTTRAQYSAVVATKISASGWLLTGDLA